MIEGVVVKIGEHMTEKQNQESAELPLDRLWTIKELAAYMQVNVKTAYTVKDKPGFPRAVKVGKSLRWVPSEIMRHFGHKRAA